MIKMVEYLEHYVPMECCTVNRLGEVDDCEIPCGDCCGECESWIITKIFDEYTKLTNKIHIKTYKHDYVKIGTKIMIKSNKNITKIKEFVEFEEDTFGQGNYLFLMEDGSQLYRREFEILEDE